MGRCFITGDTHGSLELKRLGHKRFPIGKSLTYDDTMIILGDAGFMFDDSRETKYWDDWANDLGFTIVAIFGNHERYPAIRAIPIEQWHGAAVHKVRPHIMYVENGEIFTLNDQTFFCFGGATSTDKHLRKEGISWWPEEQPTREEQEHGIDNLEKYNWKVNYILTHTAPNVILDRFWYEHDSLTNYLSFVEKYTQFDQWWFGHLHNDRSFGNKYRLVYHDIIELFG